MKRKWISRNILFVLTLIVSIFVLPVVVLANHSWGSYHWGRISNPFTLKLGDNLSSSWDSHLATTSSDWSQSSVLDTAIVAGNTNPRRCKPTSGQVQLCNSAYGNNGWLGIAQIWVSGNHITQGNTKVNDTYFATAKYNTPAWKNLVMCQEVGHTLGLNHQDENFGNTNLGTCMDYTNDPGTNQHPNVHDYEMLESIYAHLDTTSTVSQSLSHGLGETVRGMVGNPGTDENPGENPSDWGIKINDNGNVGLYVRELSGGRKLFTFVIWAK